MIALMEDFTNLEKFFAICAAVGGILFLIRLVLQFVGGDVDADTDFDADFDSDIDADVDGGDSDLSFKVLSFQGLTAFFMMFGLVGLALMRQLGWEAFRTLAGATVAGCATVWVMKLIFTKAKDLQSSGTLHMENAVGQEGTVYLSIPDTGTGKVRVSVQNHLKVFDAVSQGEQGIETGERIKVLSVISGNVMVVEKFD